MRPNTLAVLFAFLVFFPFTAAAQICVDSRNLAGVPDGSAANPFRTVQAGVDAAAPGQSVFVATGVYNEDVRIEDNAVLLLGGYLGASTVEYAGDDAGDFAAADPEANPTTLMGTGAESVVTLINAGASVVEGFRITGGGGSTTNLPYASNGGGVYIFGGAPTLRNNTIDANDPTRTEGITTLGGGIYVDDAAVIIENNVVSMNTAERGAGIAAFGGVVVIQNNTIRGNVGTGDHGGGIYVASPDATIIGNRIHENEIGRALGYGWGAGILVFNPGNHADLSFNEIFDNYTAGLGAAVFVDEGASATLRNELIYRNETSPGLAGGGAVYVDGGEINGVQVGSEVEIVNCTIADNPAQDAYLGGNGLFVEGASTVTVRNTILWGNGLEVWSDPTSTLTITFSNVAEIVPGTGNISQDPLFADAPGGDYHLMSASGRWDAAANGGAGGFVTDVLTSPSIDAGDPADDVMAETAPNGGRINQGAYGGTAEASRSSTDGPMTDVNEDGTVDAVDVQLVINGALGAGGPADVNNDGATNAVDVQLVINAALGV